MIQKAHTLHGDNCGRTPDWGQAHIVRRQYSPMKPLRTVLGNRIYAKGHVRRLSRCACDGDEQDVAEWKSRCWELMASKLAYLLKKLYLHLHIYIYKQVSVSGFHPWSMGRCPSWLAWMNKQEHAYIQYYPTHGTVPFPTRTQYGPDASGT